MNDAELKLLIENREFHHVFQPIRNLSDRSVFGYEFLIRTSKFENPEALFTYAKNKNMLIDLDIAAIFNAYITFESYQQEFMNARLFINIYPSTLTDPDFLNVLESLQSLKAISHVKNEHVVFEINGSEDIPDFSALKKVVALLKQNNYLVALDNVGEGRSSLRASLELEPHFVKLDRYFSKDLANSEKKQKLIKSLLGFFDGKTTTLVVEGFEEGCDVAAAKEIGVQLGQGYLLGRPKLSP
ncbi:EAL domain-containing protein [Pseudalkalibacillus caeni]|uniref:EAL domain-containing protein n=1 Tax=Exobacillus caeni TaxID=2574798 RepID=A0A5R9F0U4_9BACL|nr:EAL domain-containing protein [Pseudalkalibacillus caeni]TLS37252.1 EAL domain-containing protein [Pseudalkalibacillus caeni]